MNADCPSSRCEPPSPVVKRYQRLKLLAGVAATGAGLVWLAGFAVFLGPWLDEWFAAHLPQQPWLALWLTAAALGATLECVTLPIDFWSSYLLEHRFELSNQSLGGWLWKRCKSWLVGGVLAWLLLTGLYAFLWQTGATWWLWATAGWLGVTLVLSRLLPVVILPIFYKVTPLDDPTLLERLRRLTVGTGLSFEGIYRLHLSDETKKANAALAGLGRTRRVLLGDTLLEQFTPDEIEVVFAHEVGHHVYRHLLKHIGVQVVLTAVGFWLVDRGLRVAAPALGYAAWDRPAALPLLLLVLALFGLLLSPIHNAISRHFERQCDRYALDRTGKADAYRAAFVKLARLNKADPAPHPLVVWLFYDHPPINERLRLADSHGTPAPRPVE
ncbi:MAG: M48 family metallopeptidase [Gemmataceae bacterium]|nr:M48 family metallopeptidase [Gemmataceae bacterium]